MRIEDIARIARVSKSAVSLALRGKPGISEETRSRILKIAEETGYVPRSAKRNGNGGRRLGFVAFTHSDIVLEEYYKQPFFMELIHSIEKHCRQRGYSLYFTSVPIQQLDQHSAFLSNEADGILLLGTNLSAGQIRLIAERQPRLVVLDTCFETLDVSFVVMNNVQGAYLAANHLVALGHRRIGYVQSRYRMYNFDMRKIGFKTALAEAQLVLRESDVFTVAPAVVGSQEEFKTDVVRRGRDLPTALFCECDYIAISVIKSLAEVGLRVPDDVSVVGFDNIREATVITPELTTVHVEKEKMAELAVAKLCDLIEQKDATAVKTLVDTRLVVRQSSRSAETAQIPNT